jgi:DNA-binding CsgD family transcriptional regulator
MCGPDAHSDAQLLLALRSLGLSNGAYLGQGTEPVSNKAFVRLENKQGEWLGVHCHALRSADSMGAFGAKDLVLVLVHEPGLLTEPDPFVVAAMWDLSPAEAQVMVGLARGQTLQDMAQQRGVAMSTIRSQLRSTLGKTGASRQAELVSLLAGMLEVGKAQPEAALDFIREYHQIDQRAALAMGAPVGQVVSCHRHFDEAFVAQDRFYQEFLIPYGGRYSSGMKVYEDEGQAVIWGVHRPLGAQPVNELEEAWIARLGTHLHNAVAIYLAQQKVAQPASVGIELLQRMSQPLMLLDETRRIVFCNAPARSLLDAGAVLSDNGGLLGGPDLADDARLLIALRELGLSPQSYLGNGPASDKVFLRLQNSAGARLGIYLYAMRPGHAMGAFGPNSLALVMLHDPQVGSELDPFVVAATWGLTPAEA